MVKVAPRFRFIPFKLNRHGGRPAHQQLSERIRAAILSGQLPCGTRLPSSRSLAEQLAISRSTVTEAYEVLAAEGYLRSRAGAGSWVADIPEDMIRTPGRR